MTIDDAFVEIRQEWRANREELRAFAEREEAIGQMLSAINVAFEAGRRFGRTQLMEEIGMPR